MRVKARLILLSEPVWIKICKKIDEISRKDMVTGGSWIRQHKKTLSRVSGKRKKKYHPNGCVDRKII